MRVDAEGNVHSVDPFRDASMRKVARNGRSAMA